MSRTVVVDASIVAKWVLNERDSQDARRLLSSFVETDTAIIAPPILLSEVTQVFHKMVQRHLIELEYSRTVLRDLIDLISVRRTADLYLRTLVIASQLNLKTVYGAEYIALADELGAELWTADHILYESARVNFPFVQELKRDTSIAQR